MAELFGIGVPAVSKHLKNIFESGELELEATVSKMEIVRQEGTREAQRNVEFFSHDAIIAVGYRMNEKDFEFTPCSRPETRRDVNV